MQPATWKVGELARRTGLSVRTLDYYDEMGLLSPSQRTDSGHRLYTAGDVVRLQQIKSLRFLGFTRREVRGVCVPAGLPPAAGDRAPPVAVEGEDRAATKAVRPLERIAARLGSGEEVSSEELVDTVMDVIKMSENVVKYYTPEQLEYLEWRRREVGEARIRQVEAEWAELMEEVRAEMEVGTDPSNERVQALAERWMGLVNEFTGGYPGIERSVGNMWQQEETIHGLDTGEVREMMAYVFRATASSNEGRGS